MVTNTPIFELKSVGLSDKDKSILTDIHFSVSEGERHFKDRAS